MPREVKIRVSYQADAAYLMRLAHAIELSDQPSAWKKKAITLCNSLSIIFMEAESKRLRTANGD